MNASRTSVIILALWVIFVGAISATWISVSPHNLGILSVVVGIVVIGIELFVWHPWRHV